MTLVFSLLLNTCYLLLLPFPVYAASSPWTQTDWSGGSGQTSWSDTTKYDSTSGVTTSTAGQATITNTENFSNTGFESDLTSWSSARTYDLQDQFTTALAAGAVHNTTSEPSGHTRTVTDTNSKLSITGGQLSFATGGAANDGLWYGLTTRVLGRTFMGAITPNSSTNASARFGLDTNQTGAPDERFSFSSSNLLAATTTGGATALTVGTYTTGTQYQLAIIHRAAGEFFFIKGGTEFPNWTLMWLGGTSTSNLYPTIGIATTTAIYTADNIAIPTTLYTPVPLVSDGFSAATTDGSGNAENNGTTGTAWTGSTWSVSGGSVSNTPTEGSDVIVNGGFGTDTDWTKGTGWTIGSGVASSTGGSSSIYQTVAPLTLGKWYTTSFDITAFTSGGGYTAFVGGTNNNVGSIKNSVGSGYSATGRSNGTAAGIQERTSATTGSIDNVIVKELTLSSLFRSIDSGSADALIESAITMTSGTQAGLVLNLDSTSSPANFIIVYHDGTSVKVDEAVAGVYTNKATTTTTYSSTAVLRAVRYGTSLDVYYNNAKVGSTITGLTANTNTRHGLFSTYSGNTFDNFVVWDRDGYTDAPFEELTATRDTGTTYSSSAASAKLVASTTDANFTQSVNVGNTQTHAFSTYAYTDGSAVTSSDLSLLSNGSTIATTYTSVGGGMV